MAFPHTTAGRPFGPVPVAVVAGAVFVAVSVLSGLAGVGGLALAFFGGPAAAGAVFWYAADPRAVRATVVLFALLWAMLAIWPFVWILPGPLVVVAGLVTLFALPAAALALAGRAPGADGGGRGARAATGQVRTVGFGLATCTAAVVVAGHATVVGQSSNRIDPVFFALLALDLVPTAIYAIGARRHLTVLVGGFAVFAVTAAGWALFAIEDGNQFALVWVFLSWLVALAVATVVACRDFEKHRSW